MDIYNWTVTANMTVFNFGENQSNANNSLCITRRLNR